MKCEACDRDAEGKITIVSKDGDFRMSLCKKHWKRIPELTVSELRYIHNNYLQGNKKIFLK